MTGFGSGAIRLSAGAGRLTVEVKSVNQRFLDLKLSLPREYASFEAELRRRVQEKVFRGRVEITVTRSIPGGHRVAIDVDLARAYVGEWRRLKKRLRLSGDVDLSFLKGLTELYRPKEAEPLPEGELEAVGQALQRAIDELDRARAREGKRLERDMRARVARLETLTGGMKAAARASIVQARRRIEERMRELLDGKADESRVVQEAAFQAERSDVTEEIVRLGSHAAGLRDLFSSADPTGKRFEFLLQEVQREVNTVASKSCDLSLTRLAVEAKGEVEKLREQVQNVE